MIIDVHAHIGWDCVFDENFTREEQLLKHKQFNVSKSIIQPGTCHDIETVREQHDTIATLAKKFPGEFYGMANPNPHLEASVYEEEVFRCVQKLGFVGIKMHTTAHAMNPLGKDGQKVFAVAQKLNIPVMVHTGAGIPFANPSNLIEAAERFPEVKIVMAHCGMMIMAGEAFLALKKCPNLFADITWTGGFLIRHWVEALGANRFMFGTDHADNTGTELSKVRTCGLTDEQQEWILHKTAESVFPLG